MFFYFDENITEVCAVGSNWKYPSTTLDYDSAQNKQQAIIWTNVISVHAYIRSRTGTMKLIVQAIHQVSLAWFGVSWHLHQPMTQVTQINQNTGQNRLSEVMYCALCRNGHLNSKSLCTVVFRCTVVFTTVHLLWSSIMTMYWSQKITRKLRTPNKLTCR